MTAPRFITNLEMAVLAWPAAVRPEELSPPRVLPPVKTGTGSGVLVVSGASFDAHFVRVEIVAPGEPGVATYRARTDGADASSGTWGDTLLTTTGDQALLHTAAVEGQDGADTGLRLAFVAGVPLSFAAGDRWDFVTRASPVVTTACMAASADAKGLISGPDGGGQFTGDLASVDASLKSYVADLAALRLLEKRGIDPRSQDGELYVQRAERATAKLKEVGDKQRFPKVSEQETRYAPDAYLGADRGGIAAAHRGRI